jgi:hypothetical protein
VCPASLNQDNLIFVIDLHVQPIAVAFYVENHTAVPDKTGGGKTVFNVLWTIPVSLLYFS